MSATKDILHTDLYSSKVAEILCIGTELLLGNILNSNARWLSEELASLGIAHYRQTVVGDNVNRLIEVILEASNRTRFLIITGGLGPTPDDITTESLAAAFHATLETDQEILSDIKAKSINQNGMPKNNEKQALIPSGAIVIPNRNGTAPGIIWSPKPDFTVLTFPGVPYEMKAMWHETAVPWLQKNGTIREIFLSKTLHFTGIRESELAEDLSDLLIHRNPTVAPYAGQGQVKLRITSRGENIQVAQKIMNPIVKDIYSRTGSLCFGTDNESLASVVIGLLRKRGETLAVAESCTGGGIGAALASVPGASDVFLGGVIAYSNSIKHHMLNVSKEVLEEHGAVSDYVVKSMALGARKSLHSNWSIAVSGIAGPGGGSDLKPVGLIHLAVACEATCQSKQENFGSHLERQAINQLSVVHALNFLRLTLLSRV